MVEIRLLSRPLWRPPCHPSRVLGRGAAFAGVPVRAQRIRRLMAWAFGADAPLTPIYPATTQAKTALTTISALPSSIG